VYPVYSAFNGGFSSHLLDWHTSQGFQKANDHLQKNVYREEQLMGAKLQTNMSLASYWIAEKGTLLYGWSHTPRLDF